MQQPLANNTTPTTKQTTDARAATNNALELPVVGSFFLSKNMDKSPKVEILQTPEATIVRPAPAVVNVDGESRFFDCELHLKINPLSLKVIV